MGSYGGERRAEIVSGKGLGTNQKYRGRSRSPEPAAIPGRTSYTASKPWGLRDPEMKRKKRIAKYKVYTVEGRVKATLKKGLRWIKTKCSQIVHGY